MRHHTKDKGDSGVGFIIADLLSKNLQVALPISEHLPFDCIVISEDNKMIRLSIKYRTIDKHGIIQVALRSSWSDSHGVHVKQQDKGSFDATAIFCPNTKECYYIRNDELKGRAFALRIGDTRNGQHKGIRIASEYQDPKRIFYCGVEQPGSSSGS